MRPSRTWDTHEHYHTTKTKKSAQNYENQDQQVSETPTLSQRHKHLTNTRAQALGTDQPPHSRPPEVRTQAHGIWGYTQQTQPTPCMIITAMKGRVASSSDEYMSSDRGPLRAVVLQASARCKPERRQQTPPKGSHDRQAEPPTIPYACKGAGGKASWHTHSPHHPPPPHPLKWVPLPPR
jgi:hypothetical protein